MPQKQSADVIRFKKKTNLKRKEKIEQQNHRK